MNNFNERTKNLIILSHFSKFGPASLKKINTSFADLKEVFSVSANKLLEIGLDKKIVAEFVADRHKLNAAEILDKMTRENIAAISIDDPLYPNLLSKIYDAPQLLYFQGDIKNLHNCLAVVGSRKHSSYGTRATETIAGELAANGFIITSGLALGIDTIAHQAALRVKGRTIAVLGTGIDKASIYPPANRKLAEEIVAAGGAIISELPLGTEPLRFNFPLRNRIVSGLSRGVFVVEADEKSGALITASCALEQGREVFSLPGNIFSDFSRGTNNLIKQGAKPVTSAKEIIESFEFEYIERDTAPKKPAPSNPEEEKIMLILNNETVHINDIIRLSSLDTSKINSTLIIMEMKGMVKNLGGGEYTIL